MFLKKVNSTLRGVLLKARVVIQVLLGATPETHLSLVTEPRALKPSSYQVGVKGSIYGFDLSLTLRMYFPTGIYLFKVSNRNTITMCEICSKSAIKTPERRRSGIFFVNFEHISLTDH